jgi:sodium borate transporter 11
MGLFNAIGPFFGLPFVTGSLPHSPQFVRALTFAPPADAAADGSVRNGKGRAEGGSSGVEVAENRLAPLLCYAMLGLPLLFPSLLQLIPRAAINGVLAYVGVEGILGTTLWQRALLLVSPPSSFPPRLLSLGLSRVHLFTLLQLSLLLLCWLVNLSPLGLCVAFIIVSLVPLRMKVLPRLFSQGELAELDDEASAADDVAPASALPS